MNQDQEAVDVTVPLIELLRSVDFAFDQVPGERATRQIEQQRYAAAIAAIGSFLTKVDPTHADRFFVLSDALADLSIGARPPILGRTKRRSAPNPTQIEAAKANVAFALDALIALGDNPADAARTLLSKFGSIKNLARHKSHRPGYSWERTILEWRKSLSAPSRKKNALAAEIFAAGRDLIEALIKQNRQADLRARAIGRAGYAAQCGCIPGPFQSTLTCRPLASACARTDAGAVAGEQPGALATGGQFTMNQLSYSVLEACEAARIGRTNLYEAIRTGELRAVKHGKRTLILADDLRSWLENLPAVKPNRASSHGNDKAPGADLRPRRP
jgi:excisionase family DNA binding protein